MLDSSDNQELEKLRHFFLQEKFEVSYLSNSEDFHQKNLSQKNTDALVIFDDSDSMVWKEYSASLRQENPQLFVLLINQNIAANEALNHGVSILLRNINHAEIISCLTYYKSLIQNKSRSEEKSLHEISSELNQKNSELEKISFELDRFVYSASHDLRAPLTSVLGLLYLLRGDSTDENALHYINLMEESILKLDCTIKDIVAYSRNNRQEIQTEIIELPSLIRDVISNLRYLENHEFSIRESIEIESSSHFYSDRNRLQIILNNLLANSIRYRHPQRPLKINISHKNNGNEIILKVRDNGIGIDSPHLDKIFDMFYRTNESSTGSGLGLYIVKETIQKMGGSVSVDSTVLEGTTFIICLPQIPVLFN